MNKGYVYLLMSVDSSDEITYKIGITRRDINKRIKELQTGNGNKITLLKSYRTKNFLKVERFLHKKYGMSKTEAMNEWRTLTDENVLSFISDCEKADENIEFLLKNNSLYE